MISFIASPAGAWPRRARRYTARAMADSLTNWEAEQPSAAASSWMSFHARPPKRIFVSRIGIAQSPAHGHPCGHPSQGAESVPYAVSRLILFPVFKVTGVMEAVGHVTKTETTPTRVRASGLVRAGGEVERAGYAADVSEEAAEDEVLGMLIEAHERGLTILPASCEMRASLQLAYPYLLLAAGRAP